MEVMDAPYDKVSWMYDPLIMQIGFRFIGGESQFRSDIVESVPIKPTDRILELACGTGTTTKLLARKVPQGQVIGLDISHKMLEKARAKSKGYTNIEYQLRDVQHTQLPENSIDKVYATLLLHEVHLKEREAILMEAYRALRHNGNIIITDWLKTNTIQFKVLKYLEGFHGEKIFDDYLTQDIKDTITSAGFKIERVITILLGHAQIIVAQKAGG